MCKTTNKIRCVKPLKIYWKPHVQKKIPPKNPNSKIQLENPTRNPNSVNRQPSATWVTFCTTETYQMKVHFFQRHYVTMWVTWEMRSAFQIRRRGEEEWKTEGRVIPLRFFHSHSMRGLPSVERELRSTHITTTSSCTIASWYNLRPYKGCLPAALLGSQFFCIVFFFFFHFWRQDNKRQI